VGDDVDEGDDESHQLSANRSVSSVIAAAASAGFHAHIGGEADAAMNKDDVVSNHVLLVLVVCPT
jgi:hypothetical protein